MIELVNKFHPDKLADRIAGAIVDLAVKKDPNAKIAVEVLIGHGECNIIAETSVHLLVGQIADVLLRLTDDPDLVFGYKEVPQDEELAHNQADQIRCGDNGIFRGVPLTKEQQKLIEIRNLIEESDYIWRNHQLGNPLAGFNGSSLLRMVMKCNHNFTAIIRIYNADLICGGKPLLTGQTASGIDESGIALGKLHGQSGRHQNGFT